MSLLISMGSSLSFLPATGFALLLEQTKRLYHTGIKPERPLAPRRAAAVVQKHTQEHQSLPRQRWGEAEVRCFSAPWAVNPPPPVMYMVCLLMEQLPSLLLPVFLHKYQYRLYIYSTPTVLCSLKFHPLLGARWLYAWKSHTLGLLESYPAGVSKSQSPITAAFTTVALTLPITSWVATSRFLKALKNKSWVLNVSAIVLQFVILLGEYIREER